MDTKKDGVVLGALLHDIGKFMQRAEVPCRYEDNEDELCLPQFFENMEDLLPNFAGMYHKPVTPLQWIVDEADRLSAGVDKVPADEADKKVRLYPILAEVDSEGKGDKTIRHRIELNPLSVHKEVIFPQSSETLDPKEGESLTGRYRSLWDGFAEEFRQLPRKDISVFTETLTYLLEKYTWCIPGSTTDIPDVSLFDHSKTTAAIAAALYDYHESHRTVTEDAIRDREADKYLLICGDISGIQKFIYNITSKGAAKGLKGRSFLIQLFSEAAGRYILRRFKYPITNMLYAGGGRFYLLLANRDRDQLSEIRNALNTNLLDKYNGEIYLALGCCELKGEDFQGKHFPDKWRKAARMTNEDKRRKFAGLEYGKIFGPYGAGGDAETCQICKKEDRLSVIPHDDEEIRLCRDCKAAEDLGKSLSKANYLVEAYQESEGLKGGFDTPVPDTRYYFLEKPDEAKQIRAKKVVIYRLNDTDFLCEKENLSDTHALGFKFAGGAGRGKSLIFEEMVKASTGLKRLGILRMDVDNLGRIFSEGLGQNASISRVAGLSYQLSLFFGGYLNEICRKEAYRDKAMIIYSGGDDLFVVGAWDSAIELAMEIRKEFRDFVCKNPFVTLSGGIAMARKKYAIYRSAAHAGEAEEMAKDFRRTVGGQEREKDALTFLSKAMSWNDLDICQEIKETLYPLIKDGKQGKKLPAGILNRLKEIYLLYVENRAYWYEKELPEAELEEKTMYNKWLWRGVYTLSRAARQNPLFKEEIGMVRSALLGNQMNGRTSEQAIIKFIDVPVRWTEFLLRKEKEVKYE